MESNLIKDKLKIMSHKELQHASKLCSICGKQIPDVVKTVDCKG